MVRAVAVESNQDVEQLRTVLGSLERIRLNLKSRLDLIDGQIDSTSRLIEAFSGGDVATPMHGPMAANAPVRMAILKSLDANEHGLDAKAIRRILMQKFGDSLHPKTHYGVLKRLADEGLAERTGSLWSIAPPGKSLLIERSHSEHI